jgi:predicted metal-dependent phosphoesterase TrpH
LIDLHSHTTESDGTLTPQELVEAALKAGLEALAITDHDTFAGFDQAATNGAAGALELICGIELSTKFRNRSVHLLAYFLDNGPSQEFRDWIQHLQDARHRRNRELVAKLQGQGFDLTLDEVYRLGGTLPGRPHFATILVSKGYFPSIQQAFDECLSETGNCYISRDEPSFAEAVRRVMSRADSPACPIRFACPATRGSSSVTCAKCGSWGCAASRFITAITPRPIRNFIAISRLVWAWQ